MTPTERVLLIAVTEFLLLASTEHRPLVGKGQRRILYEALKEMINEDKRVDDADPAKSADDHDGVEGGDAAATSDAGRVDGAIFEDVSIHGGE